MSVTIMVSCDRCPTVVAGRVTLRGSIRPAIPGWRYVSRDTNLCPACADDFEVWRTTGPVPTGAPQ